MKKMKANISYSILKIQDLPSKFRKKYRKEHSALVSFEGEKIKNVNPLKNGSIIDEINEINKKLKITRKSAEKEIRILEKEMQKRR